MKTKKRHWINVLLALFLIFGSVNIVLAAKSCPSLPKEDCAEGCPFTDDTVKSLNENPACWNGLSENQLLSNIWQANNLQYIDAAKLQNVLAKINPPLLNFKLTNNKGPFSLNSDGGRYIQGDFGKIDINRFNSNNGYSIEVTDNKVTIKCSDKTKCGDGITLPVLSKDAVIKADDKNNIVVDLSDTAIPLRGFLFDIPGGGALTLITKTGEYHFKVPPGKTSAFILGQDKIELAENIKLETVPMYVYYKPKNGDSVVMYGDFKIFNNGKAVIEGNKYFGSYYINLNTNIGVATLPTGVGKVIYINGGRSGPGDGEVTYLGDGTIYAKTGTAGVQMFRIDPLRENIKALEQNYFDSISGRFNKRNNMWTGQHLPAGGGPNQDSVFHYDPAKNEVIEARGLFDMKVYDPKTLRPIVGVSTLARDSNIDPSKIVVAYNKDNSGALNVNLDEAQNSPVAMGVAKVDLYYWVPANDNGNINLKSENKIPLNVYLQNGAISINTPVLKNQELYNALFLQDFKVNGATKKLGEVVEGNGKYYLKFYDAEGRTASDTELNFNLNKNKLDAKTLLVSFGGKDVAFCSDKNKEIYMDSYKRCNYDGKSGQCICENWKCGIIKYLSDRECYKPSNT